MIKFVALALFSFKTVGVMRRKLALAGWYFDTGVLGDFWTVLLLPSMIPDLQRSPAFAFSGID